MQETLDLLESRGAFGSILADSAAGNPFRFYELAKSVDTSMAGTIDEYLCQKYGGTLPKWPDSGVYIIEAVGSGRCKIGVTNDVPTRIKGLQTGSPFPLRVLAVIEGGEDLEKFIHKQFAKFRKHGEWFEIPPAILTDFWRTMEIKHA